MGVLEDLHDEHKARQKRLQAAAIKKPIPTPPPPRIDVPRNSFDIVIKEVCTFYKVSEDNLLSSRRQFDIASKRQILAYMTYLMTKLTNPQIGSRMGRDPTTIWYAITKIHNNIGKYQTDIDQLEQLIRDAFKRERVQCPAIRSPA